MIRIAFIIFCAVIINFAGAQTITRYSLNSGSLNNSVVSFSVGELIPQTLSSKNGLLTQGFQQPSVFINKDGKKDLPQGLNLNFFPNPFDKYARIIISSPEEICFISLKITDLNGREILKKFFYFERNTYYATIPLDVTSFEKGLYILQISINQTILSNYKILKQ